MQIEQKQNRIYKPQSVYTYAAEECNQVSTELDNLIREGGLTPSAGDLTQVKTAVNNIVDTAANNLQEQIDAITSASDVYDIVGTYAELQAYDTTDVPLNNIIKVLQDTTHNDAATYYRLVEVSGNKVWQYVGQEGPYYTKSEIDTDFALKSELPSVATNQQVGLVKPDNSTITVSQDGTLSATGNVAAALPLFSFVWSDHLLNDASYLRSDRFSWQSGTIYSNAYQHLVVDIANITADTETIAGTTITYYPADDGHKIVLADQETNVQSIYASTGVAWYYILDTNNTRFKLPRINPNKQDLTFSDYLPIVGDGNRPCLSTDNDTQTNKVALAILNQNYRPLAANMNYINYGQVYWSKKENETGLKAILSSQNKVFAGKKYLYFYVGNFSQSATEQTAGLNSELFNGKVDLDGSNATFPHIVETYDDGNGNGYILYSNKWCEQYGVKLNITPNTFVWVGLLKQFNGTYNVTGSGISASIATVTDEIFSYKPPLQANGFYGGIRYLTDGNAYASRGFSWRACGYIA